MRIPHGEAQPRLVGMQAAEDVDVALVEDDLDRAPADASAAQPDERAQPARQLAEVEHVAGRQGVEVAGEQVEAAIVRAIVRSRLRSSIARRRSVHAACTALRCTPNTGSRRRPDGSRGTRGATGAAGATDARDRRPAHEAERRLRLRAALRHAGTAARPIDDRRPGGFLEDDEVRLAGGDDGGDASSRPLPPCGCCRSGAEAHVAFSLDGLVDEQQRYGCPSSSPRTYITKSRVAWMFTGRLTIAISCSRSGVRSGAMSGSSLLMGRECTPGTKKPVTL